MFYRHLLPSCFVGAAVVMIASPAVYAKDALLPTQVASIARGTVVRIEPAASSPGSGVIIGRYREGGTNVYTVLTAGHVVQYPDDEYTVITPKAQESSRAQRQRITLSTERDIQKLPGVDLALVKFRSDRNYQVATLGDSDHTAEGAGVYIAGFPNPGQAIKRRVFQFTSSLVSSRLDKDSVEGEQPEDLPGGYALSYTSVTRAGMSGGPVFDVSGRVVGIHGQGDREQNPVAEETEGTKEESGMQAVLGKTGFNLGIPIKIFLSMMSNSIQAMGIKFDGSEPGIFIVASSISTRGKVITREAPPTNISEDEDIDSEPVVGKPSNSRSSTPVAPQRSIKPQPTMQQNNTPSIPSSPTRPRKGFF